MRIVPSRSIRRLGHLTLLPMLAVASLALGCAAAAPTEVIIDKGGPIVSGTITATIDGVPFSARQIMVKDSELDNVLLIGADSFPPTGLVLAVALPRRQTDSLPPAIAVDRLENGEAVELWAMMDSTFMPTGTVQVLQFDAQRARGKFSAVMHSNHTDGSDHTMTVTNGSFDVRLR